MAIQISITGLTTQQQQDVADAFDAVGSRPAGTTKQQWVQLQLLRFLKSVVKGWKRSAQEVIISTQQAQIDIDYPET